MRETDRRVGAQQGQRLVHSQLLLTKALPISSAWQLFPTTSSTRISNMVYWVEWYAMTWRALSASGHATLPASSSTLIMNPRLLCQKVSYDVASNICQALHIFLAMLSKHIKSPFVMG